MTIPALISSYSRMVIEWTFSRSMSHIYHYTKCMSPSAHGSLRDSLSLVSREDTNTFRVKCEKTRMSISFKWCSFNDRSDWFPNVWRLYIHILYIVALIKLRSCILQHKPWLHTVSRRIDFASAASHCTYYIINVLSLVTYENLYEYSKSYIFLSKLLYIIVLYKIIII